MNKETANIYLIGMMGSGKSTIGEHVARELGMNFVDSDLEIEKKTGKSVNALFSDNGEEEFRSLEQEFIDSGHPDRNAVISCGGGLCTIDGMLNKIKQKGLVICLWASPHIIFERLREDRSRPLLNVKDPKREIQRICDSRKDTYLCANLVIDCDNLSISQVAEKVVNEARNLA
jgi:shikimate kinase